MRRYIGQKVRTVIQVIGSDIGSVVGKSTDDLQIVVRGSSPTPPLTTYLEVIGIAESDNAIRAETWTNFGNSFGNFTDSITTVLLSISDLLKKKFQFQCIRRKLICMKHEN